MRLPALACAAVALCGCWDFRGAIEARCADASLSGCPDSGSPAGGGAGGGGGVGGGTGTGGGSAGDGGLSCGATRCISDGGRGFCLNGWCWQSPLPQGNTLTAVWGSAANDVWAAGSTGMLMHWNGAVWTSYQGELPMDLNAQGLWGASASAIWLVGGASGTPYPPLRFDGAAWSFEPWLSGGLPPQLLAVAGDDAGSVVAVGRDSLVAVRAADGWRAEKHTLLRSVADSHINAVVFDQPGSCWVGVGGSRPGVARCDGGEFDLDPGSHEVRGLASTGPGELWAAGFEGARGVLQARTDGGWRVVIDGGAALFAVTAAGSVPIAVGDDRIVNGLTRAEEASMLWNLAAWSTADRNAAWAVGLRGELVRSTSPGNWSAFSSGVRTTIFSLFVSRTRVFGTTQNGALVFPGGALGWRSDFARTFGSDISDVWISADDAFAVLIDQFSVYETSSPLNFTTGDGGYVDFLEPTGVWGSSKNDVWVVSRTGATLRRTAQGWDAGFDAGTVLQDIDGTGAGRAWMVGNGGATLRRTADSVWTPEPLGASSNLNSVWVPPVGSRSDAIAAGEGVYSYLDGGWRVLEAPGAVIYNSVWGFSEDDFYAVGSQGSVVHFRQGVPRRLELGTREELFAVAGRSDAGVKEVWVAGFAGIVLRAVVP